MTIIERRLIDHYGHAECVHRLFTPIRTGEDNMGSVILLKIGVNDCEIVPQSFIHRVVNL